MNGKEYREELMELGKFISSKEQIAGKIKQLENESWELEKKMKALKKVSDKEQEDVSELEKAGFTKLLYHVINKYDEKMEKEKREAIAAQAKYETAKNEYQSVNTELDKMRVELLKIDSAKRSYDEKYSKYKEYLKSINSREADNILLIEAKLEGYFRQKQNYTKALGYCEGIVTMCDDLKKDLKGAKLWNNIDMFISGSYVIHTSKYEKLDRGQKKIENLQIYINGLRNLISTSYEMPNYLRTSINDNKFADCMYDNLITDGEVHDKINTSVSEVEMVKARIDQISVELKHESDKLDTSISRLEKEREELMADSDI